MRDGLPFLARRTDLAGATCLRSFGGSAGDCASVAETVSWSVLAVATCDCASVAETVSWSVLADPAA